MNQDKKIPGSLIFRQKEGMVDTASFLAARGPWQLLEDRIIASVAQRADTGHPYKFVFGSTVEKERLQRFVDIHNANIVLGITDEQYNDSISSSMDTIGIS